MSTTETQPDDLFITPEDRMIHVAMRDGGLSWMQWSREGLLDMVQENLDLRQRVQDLDYLANRAAPDRFLPKLMAELEHRANTVGTPRDEAYAMAVLLIRKAIREIQKP